MCRFLWKTQFSNNYADIQSHNLETGKTKLNLEKEKLKEHCIKPQRRHAGLQICASHHQKCWLQKSRVILVLLTPNKPNGEVIWGWRLGSKSANNLSLQKKKKDPRGKRMMTNKVPLHRIIDGEHHWLAASRLAQGKEKYIKWSVTQLFSYSGACEVLTSVASRLQVPATVWH